MNRSGPSASCGAKGSLHLLQNLAAEVQARGVVCEVESINCLLYCQQGPNVRLLPEGKLWHKVDAETCEHILQHLQNSP